MPTSVRDSLQLILAGYTDALATEVFGREHELWKVFEDLEEIFSNSSAVRRRAGDGDYAAGVYCVLKEGG